MAEREVFLTREGFKKLDAELEHLRRVKRPEIAERIRLAKEFTDTVDNSEYDEVKEEQGFVEGRIQDLELLLANAQFIDEHPATDFARLGSRVSVESSDGEREMYTIVGSAEADPRHGMVSNESPVGRALLGHKVSDVVTVVAPGGSFTLRITALG